jgi:hypothetical protein
MPRPSIAKIERVVAFLNATANLREGDLDAVLNRVRRSRVVHVDLGIGGLITLFRAEISVCYWKIF